MRSARRLAFALSSVLTAAPAATFAQAAPPAGADFALFALVPPDLGAMDPAVREQLLGLRAEVESLRVRRADARELATGLGQLGGLYFLYGLPLHADAALADANRLAPEDYRWSYLHAFTRQSGGDVEAAAAGYRRTADLAPDYLPAWVRLGEVLLERGAADEAAAAFERGLALDPGCAACEYGLGRAAAARGDAAGAAARFERVLELQPDAAEVRYPLGLAYRELGDLDRARDEIARRGPGEVRVRDPVLAGVRALGTGSAVHYARGQRALAEGDLATAEAELRQAVEANPDGVPALRALGLTLRRRNAFDEAEAAYRRAAELEPANALNHHELGLILAERGKVEAAAASFRRALELTPHFPDARLGLAISLARAGRPAEALPHLDALLAADPDGGDARLERAMALAALGRRDEALVELAALVEREPGRLAARLNLGLLHELAGDDAAARPHLAAAAAPGAPLPVAARARLALGRVAERAGRADEALAEYREAVRLAPDLPPARLRLGSAAAAAGRFDEAAEAYAALVAAAPHHPAARTAALAGSTARIRAGRTAEAAAALAEALAGTDPAAAPAIAYTLSLLRAAAAEPSVRDGDAAVELARAAYGAAPTPLHAQAVGMAYAGAGRFDEAVRAQERTAAQLERAGPAELLPGARRRLELYRRGEPAREPWRDDPLLLYPAVLPLPDVD